MFSVRLSAFVSALEYVYSFALYKVNKIYYIIWALEIVLKNNVVTQTVHTVGLTEMWLIYAISLLLEESLGTAHLCTIHKEVLLSRFLLLLFVDKTCRTALSFRFPMTLSEAGMPSGGLLFVFVPPSISAVARFFFPMQLLDPG